MVVVYKANPESLQAVLGLLRKEGFSPTTLEDPSTPAVLSGAGKATYLISVVVPRSEAPGARSVLRKWDEVKQSDIKKTTKTLAGPFLFSVMVAVGFALVFLLFGILVEAVALLFVIWLVVFAVAANAEKITQKVKRNRKGKKN